MLHKKRASGSAAAEPCNKGLKKKNEKKKEKRKNMRVSAIQIVNFFFHMLFFFFAKCKKKSDRDERDPDCPLLTASSTIILFTRVKINKDTNERFD